MVQWIGAGASESFNVEYSGVRIKKNNSKKSSIHIRYFG